MKTVFLLLLPPEIGQFFDQPVDGFRCLATPLMVSVDAALWMA